MEYQKRKPIRLNNYNYSNVGIYFLTICTLHRENILSTINVGDGVPDVPKIKLTPTGTIVEKHILSVTEHMNINLSEYVIMPNHIHLLVWIGLENGTSRTPSPTNQRIPMFVSTLKRMINKEIGNNIFQRAYHDHIVRNYEDVEKYKDYIRKNPENWYYDKLYS